MSLHMARAAVTNVMQATPPPIEVFASPLPLQARTRLFFYLGVLVSVLSFGSPSGGLIDIPVSFFLKNRFHLEAHELADFRLIAAVPLYLSFAFGVFRDWDPLALGDRGLLVLFGAITALLYIAFAFIPISYGMLLIGMLLLTTAHLFAAAAQNGLIASVGRRYAITGQISAIWNIFLIAPAVVAFLLGGTLSQLLEYTAVYRAQQTLFLSGAVVMGAVVCWGFWNPALNLQDFKAARISGLQLKRLAQHWPIYPALLIWLLWNFAPGSLTPLQYYLQNVLMGNDVLWGQWNAIFTASFAPTFVVFGLICRRLPLRSLLIWGSVAAIPQMIPLLYIQSSTGALLAALPIGLLGGVATAAYTDLIIRCTPHGLEGTTMMLSSSIYFISSRFGDVLGAYIYSHYGGFTPCVIAIVIAYALIVPVIFLIPRTIIATPDC
jgi:MFS family permease